MKSIFRNTAVIIGLIVFLVLIIAAFVFGRMSNSTEPKTEVTSKTILEKITDQYFVVTKTYFLNEDVTIKATQGSDWKDFLWGKELRGSGTVRVDYGVDMSKLKESDITINEGTKTVMINMPDPSILDTSVTGDIKFETDKGILKSLEELIKDTKSDDYNSVVNEMTSQARMDLETDTQISTESRQDAKKLLNVILNQMGYKVAVYGIDFG